MNLRTCERERERRRASERGRREDKKREDEIRNREREDLRESMTKAGAEITLSFIVFTVILP